MKVEQINFGEANLRVLVEDETVFGVAPSHYSCDKYTLKRLSECEIGQVLSGEIAIIRVLKD